MEVEITQADFERFVGRLYLERCQYEKAAEQAAAKLAALEADRARCELDKEHRPIPDHPQTWPFSRYDITAPGTVAP